MINYFKNFPLFLSVIFGISPILMGFTTPHFSKNPNNNPQQISLKFNIGNDRGAPATTGGGGTREPVSCLTTKVGELSLNSLTPTYSNIAITASATPTFYYYIPPTAATLGELVITDLNQKLIYQETFTLPTQPGIMKIKALPKIPLSPDQSYEWTFKIICTPKILYNDIILKGNLEYQKVETTSSIEDPLEKAKFYAKKGIWLETLDNTAQVRSTSPNDWTELLQSAGLKEMISQPFVECCQSNNSTSSSSSDSPKTPF